MVKTITGECSQTLGPLSQKLSGTVTRAIDLIEKAEDVPIEAKKSIKEWFKEKLDSLTNTDIDNLVELLPDGLLEHLETIQNILQQVL